MNWHMGRWATRGAVAALVVTAGGLLAGCPVDSQAEYDRGYADGFAESVAGDYLYLPAKVMPGGDLVKATLVALYGNSCLHKNKNPGWLSRDSLC